MRKPETIHAALSILRCCIDRTSPDPADLETLRKAVGLNAEHMEADELARAVVQQYIDDMEEGKAKSKGCF